MASLSVPECALKWLQWLAVWWGAAGSGMVGLGDVLGSQVGCLDVEVLEYPQ